MATVKNQLVDTKKIKNVIVKDRLVGQYILKIYNICYVCLLRRKTPLRQKLDSSKLNSFKTAQNSIKQKSKTLFYRNSFLAYNHIRPLG